MFWLYVVIRYWLAWKRCSIQVIVDLPGSITCLYVALPNMKILFLKHIAFAILKQNYIFIKRTFAQCSQVKEKFSITGKVHGKLSSFRTWLGRYSLVHKHFIICYFEIVERCSTLLVSVTMIYFSLKSKWCPWVDASFLPQAKWSSGFSFLIYATLIKAARLCWSQSDDNKFLLFFLKPQWKLKRLNLLAVLHASLSSAEGN